MERVLKETLPNGFGYEWTDSPSAKKRRQYRAARLSHLRDAGVLDLVGAVRELGLAAGGHSHRADVPSIGDGGVWLKGSDNNVLTQSVHRAGGSGLQECDLIVEFARGASSMVWRGGCGGRSLPLALRPS